MDNFIYQEFSKFFHNKRTKVFSGLYEVCPAINEEESRAIESLGL